MPNIAGNLTSIIAVVTAVLVAYVAYLNFKIKQIELLKVTGGNPLQTSSSPSAFAPMFELLGSYGVAFVPMIAILGFLALMHTFRGMAGGGETLAPATLMHVEPPAEIVSQPFGDVALLAAAMQQVGAKDDTLASIARAATKRKSLRVAVFAAASMSKTGARGDALANVARASDAAGDAAVTLLAVESMESTGQKIDVVQEIVQKHLGATVDANPAREQAHPSAR